jgi:alkylhydroperoxidase family enzyme
MTALDAVEWEDCLLEPVHNRDAERQIRKALGMVPPALRYFLDSPWVVDAMVALEQAPMLHVSPDLVEMVALVVSQDNSCRYCYTATRSAMKILGFPDARIDRLEGDFLGGELSRSDKAALDFARCVSRAAPLATCRDAGPLLENGGSPGAVKEIATLAACHVFFNRVSTLPALPPAEVDFADRWWARWFRPLIAGRIRPRRATAPAFLTAEQRSGPFAEFVNALDGLPVAARLRSIIDAAWRDSALSPRVKALIFAVVAHGIACAPAEREAVRLLVAEGVAPQHVPQVLAHLSAPDLDPLEQAAAALARESIWYRPAELQRHARLLRPRFTRQQFVELIGLAALANAICRLAVALELAQPER